MLWGGQMFVLPCLMVFFLCPCGSIYKPDAPHGKRELSAVADFVGTVAVLPVVPLIAVGDQVSVAKYHVRDATGKQKLKEGVKGVGNVAAATIIAPVVMPPIALKEEVSTLKPHGASKQNEEAKDGKAGAKPAAPHPSSGTHSKQGGI